MVTITAKVEAIDLKTLKVGDIVEITYTEALMFSVDAGKTK
jgi:hypothetical protein